MDKRAIAACFPSQQESSCPILLISGTLSSFLPPPCHLQWAMGTEPTELMWDGHRPRNWIRKTKISLLLAFLLGPGQRGNPLSLTEHDVKSRLHLLLIHSSSDFRQSILSTYEIRAQIYRLNDLAIASSTLTSLSTPTKTAHCLLLPKTSPYPLVSPVLTWTPFPDWCLPSVMVSEESSQKEKISSFGSRSFRLRASLIRHHQVKSTNSFIVTDLPPFSAMNYWDRGRKTQGSRLWIWIAAVMWQYIKARQST